MYLNVKLNKNAKNHEIKWFHMKFIKLKMNSHSIDYLNNRTKKKKHMK